MIHHTAAASDYTTDYETAKSKVRATQNYHMDTRGWCDIGYHFMVSAGGHIFEGRKYSMSGLPKGAHDGCNADSFGFTPMGYFHSPYNHSFTSTIQNALYNVIAWRMPTGWSPYGSGTYCSKTVGRVDGHRKVGSTACPGDIIFAQIGSDYFGGTVRNGIASRRSCGSTSKTARDVDNTSSGFSASSDWATGSSGTEKYGTDYRWRATAAVSDPAQWSTSLNTSATWNVRAWWPSGDNRSPTAPYIVTHGSGTTTVHVNQQVNGGKWNLLGSWSMGGSVNVKLSCWTGTGYVVMADAIRWD
jgi:hypothetical protein